MQRGDHTPQGQCEMDTISIIRGIPIGSCETSFRDMGALMMSRYYDGRKWPVGVAWTKDVIHIRIWRFFIEVEFVGKGIRI